MIGADWALRIADLESQLPGWMEKEHVPGVSVALLDDGESVWCKGFGVQSALSQQPVTTDTLFEAASLTKPVFAYAALKLWQMGELDLDVPLTAYLPARYLADEPRLEAISTRLVLSHRTGFPNWRPDDKPLSIHFTPGECFSYSGEGYVYLQKVIEYITGEPVAAYLDRTVFRPLGMTSSSLLCAGMHEDNVAQGHDQAGNPVEKRVFTEGNAAYTLHTTPSDLVRFMKLMLRPPKDDEMVVRQMLTSQIHVNYVAPWHDDWPQTDSPVNDAVSWGLGWGLQHDTGKDAFWHWGDNGVFQCCAIGFPAYQRGLVCMTNGRNGRGVWNHIVTHFFGTSQPGLVWLNGLYERE